MSRLLPYPRYGHGVTWAPIIPTDWSGVALKWVARIYAGGTPDRSNTTYWQDGTVPWLNSGAVNDGIITKPSEFITEEALSNSSARWVPAGSVVIALAGQGKTKGTPARLEIASTTNQSMAAIVPNSSVDYRYVYYWLAANYQSIRSLGGGDLRDGLNLQHIGSIVMPLPSKVEQTGIANYLDRETALVDALVDEQQSLVVVLRERRSALLAQIATGGNDSAPTCAIGPPWVDSIPAHWRVVRLKDVARIESGHTPSRSREELWKDCYIPWISLNDVGSMGNTEYISETVHRISDAGVANSSARLLPRETVVLSRDATIGKAAIMAEPMATSQHFVAWICGPNLLPRYLWLLLSAAMQQYFDSLTDGATLRTIGMGDIRALRIPLPPREEQQRLVDLASAQARKIDTLIAEAEGIVEVAKERRKALITAAVTGQFDVRGDDA